MTSPGGRMAGTAKGRNDEHSPLSHPSPPSRGIPSLALSGHGSGWRSANCRWRERRPGLLETRTEGGFWSCRGKDPGAWGRRRSLIGSWGLLGAQTGGEMACRLSFYSTAASCQAVTVRCGAIRLVQMPCSMLQWPCARDAWCCPGSFGGCGGCACLCRQLWGDSCQERCLSESCRSWRMPC